MRVLVTGGAGFIGSAFVRFVLSEHNDVRVTTFDALTYAGNRTNLAAVLDDPRHTFVHGDVRDADALREAAQGHDALVHFAAESHVDRSLDDAHDFLSTNVVGTGVVLDVARHLGVERVLHVSTDEVYGSIADGRTTEDAPLRPTSPYAVSKASGDMLALAHHASHGTPVVVSRPTNTYGPYHHPEKMIPLFITALLSGGDVPLYGDGGNVREWLHVDDNVAAQWLLLTEGAVGEAYNAGPGAGTTNLDLTRRILALTGADQSRVEHVVDRPGHDRRYAVDAARLGALGWHPEVSLDEGLARTVAWYRANEPWWQPLRAAGASRRRGLATG